MRFVSRPGTLQLRLAILNRQYQQHVPGTCRRWVLSVMPDSPERTLLAKQGLLAAFGHANVLVVMPHTSADPQPPRDR